MKERKKKVSDRFLKTFTSGAFLVWLLILLAIFKINFNVSVLMQILQVLIYSIISLIFALITEATIIWLFKWEI